MVGCDYCSNEPEAGYIEMDNNGPIVGCPVCNPITKNEQAWDMAEKQRAMQKERSPQGEFQ